MNWIQRLVAWLASVTAIDVGRENDGVDRPLFSAGTDIDKDWAELFSELEDSRTAWRSNPMARRVVGLVTGYVVGAGITVSSEYGPLQAFIDLFWNHSQNRMPLRLDEWCDEMTRSGELFPVLFTNVHDGMSYVRAIPASRIEEIRWRPGDYEMELRYRETTDPGEDERWWLSPEGDRASQAGGDDLRPWMLHYAVNRPVGAVRGEGDMVPVLPWLKRYNRWLEDRVRLNAAVRSFLWVVYGARRVLNDLQERYRRPPQAGTVIVAEDGAERWEAVAPNLNARDAQADGRAIRWMIAAGGPGTSLVDFGEGEDSNLATARATAEQRRRFLLRRQAYFCWMLADLTAMAFNRYALVRGMKRKTVTAADVIVTKPDISTEDNATLAGAIVDLVRSLLDLRGFLGDSEALRRLGLRLFVKYSGESVTEQEFEKLMEGEHDEAGQAGGNVDDEQSTGVNGAGGGWRRTVERSAQSANGTSAGGGTG